METRGFIKNYFVVFDSFLMILAFLLNVVIFRSISKLLLESGAQGIPPPIVGGG